MPTTISPFLAGVWFMVGLTLGAGWTLGAWVVARVLATVFR